MASSECCDASERDDCRRSPLARSPLCSTAASRQRPPPPSPVLLTACSTLASKLHLSETDAEKWLIELIRQSQLDAKIDSTGRQVLMSVAPPSVYQQVIEKTRDLTSRTRTLADNVEASLNEGGGGGRYRDKY